MGPEFLPSNGVSGTSVPASIVPRDCCHTPTRSLRYCCEQFVLRTFFHSGIDGEPLIAVADLSRLPASRRIVGCRAQGLLDQPVTLGAIGPNLGRDRSLHALRGRGRGGRGRSRNRPAAVAAGA